MKTNQNEPNGSIRKLRELKGLSREALAADMKLSVSTIARLERGTTRRISMPIVESLASRLGSEVYDILRKNAK